MCAFAASFIRNTTVTASAIFVFALYCVRAYVISDEQPAPDADAVPSLQQLDRHSRRLPHQHVRHHLGRHAATVLVSDVIIHSYKHVHAHNMYVYVHTCMRINW